MLDLTTNVTKDYKQDMSLPENRLWTNVMNKEIQFLSEHGVFEPVPVTEDI